jgi:hypothetical protein
MMDFWLEPARTLVKLYDFPVLFSASWGISALSWLIAWLVIIPLLLVEGVKQCFPAGRGEVRSEEVLCPEYLTLGLLIWMWGVVVVHKAAPELDRDWTGQMLVLVAGFCIPVAAWAIRDQLARATDWLIRLGALGSMVPALIWLLFSVPFWLSGNAQGLEWAWWLVPFLFVLWTGSAATVVIIGNLLVLVKLFRGSADEYPWWLYLGALVFLVSIIGCYVHLWAFSQPIAFAWIVSSVGVGCLFCGVVTRREKS